jgi:type I restriction enzyme S subunit
MKHGWEIKKLGEVCIIKPPKNEARCKLKADDKVSFVPMEDLGINQKILLPKHERTLSEVAGSYTYFAENDVLLAKITPCFENGKLGIAKSLRNRIGFGSSEYIVFRAGNTLYNEYLYYFLSQDNFRINGAKRMTGAVGHKRVAKEYIEESLIPLPPLPEQQRIVAILDEAFAAIAQAKANAEQNLKNAKELFESYLQEVFSNGKLKVENGEWEDKRLNEISENLDSKRIPITKNVRNEGTIPYYGASGIVDYVAEYLFDEDLLCISEDGANLLARTYPIAFSISGKTWVNNHAHVLRFKNIVSQKFVELYLNSIKLNDFVSGMAQPKLNQSMLNKIPIPFPKSTEEQKNIVAKLDALSAETKRLEAIYQKKIEDLEELKKSILQKAFNGELNTSKEIAV